MTNPILTIGMPVHNGEAYLAAALDSVLAQTMGDIEVVISDNASTDATRAIGESYARRDPRVRYTRTDANIGAGPNFNRVFGLCRTPFFKWMAHDDLLDPAWAERCLKVLAEDAGVVLAHTAITLVDETGRPLPVRQDGKVIDRAGRRHHDREPPHLAEGAWAPDRFAEVLRRMNWCTAVFGMMRSDALRRTHLHGSYYEADRVLLAEMALLGRFCQLDAPLFIKRCHGGVSVLKTFREQARMIDPAVHPWPRGIRLRLGYLKTLGVGDLGVVERAACAVTVARVTLRNRLTYRLRTGMPRRRAGDPVPQRERPV
ncbi:MAG TPA: glycosyltransferase family 2 protein [Candidatus Omnitrophota bacterium]|nr:glycosyltransferase family 2 protein [Candidatus Omnitrophota bacterium]